MSDQSAVTLAIHFTRDTWYNRDIMRQMLSYFDIARHEVIILLACQTTVGLKMSVSFLFVLKRTLETVVVYVVHWHLPPVCPGNDPLTGGGGGEGAAQCPGSALLCCLLIQLLVWKWLGRRDTTQEQAGCDSRQSVQSNSLTDCIKTLHHMQYVCTGQQHHIHKT